MIEIRTNYKMSNADLCMFTSNLITFMTRDSAEFAARGVDSTDITALETLSNAFEIFPPDEYYKSAVSGYVDTKNNTRDVCTADIQLISGYFEQKWGEKNFRYKQLRIKGIHIMSDNNFLVSCRNVAAVAEEYLSDLTAEGLTQTDIDALTANAQTFEDNLNSIASAIALRDEKAQERALKGNELYSYVSKYCKLGKIIWENVDEAKYNDYVIYPTVHSRLSKPQNVAVEYVGGSPPLNHISWDAVTDATSYLIYVSIRDIGAPSGTFNLLDEVTDVFADVPPVDNKRNYYKIKAKNAVDTSYYSDEVYVDVSVS